MPKCSPLTYDFLYEQYITLQKSTILIAEETLYSPSWISARLKLLKIPARVGGIVSGPKRRMDLTGLKVGKLEVISIEEPINAHTKRVRHWLCRCECGTTKSISRLALRAGKLKGCGCNSRDTMSHRLWKGYGEISGRYFNIIKEGASSRNIYIDPEMTLEYIWNLFLHQDRKCALTGIPIHFKGRRSGYKDQTASLDRKNSDLGYTKDNIQWVHKSVNIMKRDFPQDYFKEICRLVTEMDAKNA